MTKGNGKIGILGGTFNPIHYGHLRTAEEAREKLNLEKILFIPAGNPPLKDRDLADAHHRYEMTRLSTETNPYFEVSDIECRRGGKSYTVETFAALRERYPSTDFYFILGIDSFLDMSSWYQPEKLMESTNFVVVSRPGFNFSSLSSRISAPADILSDLDASALEMHHSVLESGRKVILLNVTPMDLSATAMRSLLKKGKSIKYLLPETAESFIISNKLYREGSDHL